MDKFEITPPEVDHTLDYIGIILIPVMVPALLMLGFVVFN